MTYEEHALTCLKLVAGIPLTKKESLKLAINIGKLENELEKRDPNFQQILEWEEKI